MRKTVSELTRIKADVSLTREKLYSCSETLESLTFELSNLNLDDIRTDEDGNHTAILKEIRQTSKAFNLAVKQHAEAVKKYREFFVC
jgi:seryl-tRNA synthetase